MRRILFTIAICSGLAASAQAEGTPPAAAADDAAADAAAANDADAVDADAAAADAVDDDAGADVAATDVAKPATPPPPPFDDESTSNHTFDIIGSFFRSMLMLVVVLALVWLTLSKGLGKLVERAQAGKRVKVIERIALDTRRSLFLVEIDGKQMVLGGGDVTRLHDMGANERPFSTVLGQTTGPPPQTSPASSMSSASRTSATSEKT